MCAVEAHHPPLYNDVSVNRVRRSIPAMCEGMLHTSECKLEPLANLPDGTLCYVI
jgi:hypothetical protein